VEFERQNAPFSLYVLPLAWDELQQTISRYFHRQGL
jgi:hypothetical protein